MKKIVLAILFLTLGQAHAALVSFGPTGNSSFTGNAVNYYNGSTAAANSGYQSVAAATATDFVAFNPYAVSPSTFTWASSGTFDLTSFVIAGAWGTQTLNIAGYNGSSIVGSADYFVSTLASTFTANWSALTHFIITTGTDFIQTQNLTGAGQHWALNDIRINENISAVPIPAALFMFAPALLGFFGFRRRKAQA